MISYYIILEPHTICGYKASIKATYYIILSRLITLCFSTIFVCYCLFLNCSCTDNSVFIMVLYKPIFVLQNLLMDLRPSLKEEAFAQIC